MKKILLLIVLVTTTVGIGGFYKVYADTKKDFSTERVKGVDSYAPVFVTNQKIAFMNETWDVIKGPDKLGAGNYLIASEEAIGSSVFTEGSRYYHSETSVDGYQESVVKILVDGWYKSNISGTNYEQYVQPVTLPNPPASQIIFNSDTDYGNGWTTVTDQYATHIDEAKGEKQAFLMGASDVSTGIKNGPNQMGQTDEAINHASILEGNGFRNAWLRSPDSVAWGAAVLNSSFIGIYGQEVYLAAPVVPSLIIHMPAS